MTNFIGILSQGMRIAPPEAPPAGYMFGKGIYFADMFAKSAGYTHTNCSKSKMMLLCEVALGASKKCLEAEYVESLPAGVHSVHGCGSRGPDYKNRRFVTPEGYGLPLGPPIKYQEPEDWRKN